MRKSRFLQQRNSLKAGNSFKIPAIYFLGGLLWIGGAHGLPLQPAAPEGFFSAKLWADFLFVLGSTLLLYGVMNRLLRQARQDKALWQEMEERYKSLFEQNPDAIALFDRQGYLTSANTATEKMTGYSINELTGKHLCEFVAEEEAELVSYRYSQALKGNFPFFESIMVDKWKNGIQVSLKYVPIVNRGDIVGVYVIAKDLTEWKRAEELLRKSDRLSVVGQLAAGVAHEIRNPLTTLSGFVQLLRERIEGHEHYFQIMSSELERINSIVSEFMLLAKPQVLTYNPGDLRSILDHVIALANTHAIMSDVSITLHDQGDLPLIYCAENQLKQVFINILKNSIEAMPDGGEIAIEVGRQDDSHVFVRFQDTGCGISPDRIARLGEPFYSTKEKGMGLGLMVSYKIIEAHGGKMVITSELGKGTLVEIVLPVNREEEKQNGTQKGQA